MTKTAEKPSRQPSQQAKQKVRDAFDAGMLATICTTWDFSPYGQRVDLPGRERFYYYQDNGSDILAVAHLDSVQYDGSCHVIDTNAGLLAVSGTLDDRLGAYVILELLPNLGITCDWLLTTDEEMGMSTADCFESEKQYNWIIQFDRGGTDVVMYQYETPELKKLVEDAGARVGMGSYSDICVLEDLGCPGFNWGVGYQDYHGERSHAWLEDTFRMVARFVNFYNANAATPLTHHSMWSDDDEWVNYREMEDNVKDLTLAEALVFGGGRSGEEDDGRFPVADCAHLVDLLNEDTYVKFDGGDVIICSACASV